MTITHLKHMLRDAMEKETQWIHPPRHCTPEISFEVTAFKKVAHRALFKNTFWIPFSGYHRYNADVVLLHLRVQAGRYRLWAQQEHLWLYDIDPQTAAWPLRNDGGFPQAARRYSIFWLLDQVQNGHELPSHKDAWHRKVQYWNLALQCMDSWETHFFGRNSLSWSLLNMETTTSSG